MGDGNDTRDPLLHQLFVLTELVGNLQTAVGEAKDALGELRDEVRKLPCRDRSGVIPGPACPAQPGRPKRSSEEVRNELEEWKQQTGRHMLTEAQQAATRTVEERLAAQEQKTAALEQARAQARNEQRQEVEQRRGSLKFLVDMLKTAGPAVVAIVVALGVRCEMVPQSARPAQVQHVQQPAPRVLDLRR